MPTQITDATISSAIKRSKAGAFEANITDSKCPGLTLRITSSGTSTWLLRYRVGGKRKNITIGQWPVWGIAEAREKARALRRAVDEGWMWGWKNSAGNWIRKRHTPLMMWRPITSPWQQKKSPEPR